MRSPVPLVIGLEVAGGNPHDPAVGPRPFLAGAGDGIVPNGSAVNQRFAFKNEAEWAVWGMEGE